MAIMSFTFSFSLLLYFWFTSEVLESRSEHVQEEARMCEWQYLVTS